MRCPGGWSGGRPSAASRRRSGSTPGRGRALPGRPRDAGVVCCAPARLLANLDHDAVAGEDGADDGAYEVVEGVIPADEGRHDAQWLIMHRALLVGQQQVRRPLRGSQGLLAVLDGPLELLGRHHDLAQLRVDHGLARVERADPTDLLLVVEDVLQYRAQHPPPLGEARPGPFLLCCGGLCDGTVEAGGGRRVHEAQKLAGGWRIALYSRRSGGLDVRGLQHRCFLGQLWRRDRISEGRLC